MKPATLFAAAASLASSTSAQYIGLLAAHSASPIHLLPISAAGQRLYLGQPTASYCPSVVQQTGDCPPGTDTNFVFANGTLSMGAVVPGGQTVFIDQECGAVMYTQAHSNNIPDGAILGGWQLDFSNALGFLSHEDGLVACSTQGNVDQGPWEVYVQLPGVDLGDACLGMDVIAGNETSADAWQYT